MSGKKSNDLPKGDDLLAELDQLAVGSGNAKAKASSSKPKTNEKPSSTPDVADPLKEFEELARSRPQTPSKKVGAAAAVPPPRKSTESGRERDFHKGLTPATDGAEVTEKLKKEAEKAEEAIRDNAEQAQAQSSGSGGGGWWGGFGGGLGGIMGAASAAVEQARTQAEHLAKELQNNEEAQKWAEHMKGNAAILRSYGGDLGKLTGDIRSRALPGLTDLLHTLAPPISSHERLQVHITHDLTGYPSLDPLVHSVFSRVMAQVEGGDLMVLQKGNESGPRTESTAGWSDGPWWRDVQHKRSIGAVKGLVEGSKLVRASAEAYSGEYFTAKGGLDEAKKQATEVLSESNPTRSSDIFLSFQAINQTTPVDLFAGSSTDADRGKGAENDKPEDGKPEDKEEIVFALYLHDPIHSLSFGTLTQPLPGKWINWLDLPDAIEPGTDATQYLPSDIADLIAGGGVDPREWVAEWLEESLALGVGVLAQRYVSRRMGVGESGVASTIVHGIRTGKAEEAGAGELARAM